MSDRLRINMGELEALWHDLQSVATDFGAIESCAGDLGAAVGHARLATEIHSFEAGWDDQRRKLVESMDTLWQQARAVHEAFEQADTALAEPLK